MFHILFSISFNIEMKFDKRRRITFICNDTKEYLKNFIMNNDSKCNLHLNLLIEYKISLT